MDPWSLNRKTSMGYPYIMRIWYEYAINMMDFSYDGIITKQRYDTNISSKHTIHNIYIYIQYISFSDNWTPLGFYLTVTPSSIPWRLWWQRRLVPSAWASREWQRHFPRCCRRCCRCCRFPLRLRAFLKKGVVKVSTDLRLRRRFGVAMIIKNQT